MSKEIYDADFYRTRHENKKDTAMEICRILKEIVPSINSAVDFGCAGGTFLHVLNNLGTEEILGLDGPWVKEWLVISKDKFLEVNFEKPVKLSKKYDLAFSLEVAEHIPEKYAAQFIESITEASDFILFSAAIPGQGGVMHVNEQWQSYWCNLFAQKNFVCLDYLRSIFWDNEKITYPMYKQNCLLYVKKERVSEIKKLVFDFPLNVVHPEMFTYIVELEPRFRELPKIFLKKLKKRLLRILREK